MYFPLMRSPRTLIYRLLYKSCWIHSLLALQAEDKLNSWHHKFAAAAVEALSSCFNLWKLEMAEEHTETFKWLLEGTENSRVFYYRSYHDELEDGAAEDAVPTVNPKGIFQSYLIANMLATHYKAIYGPHARGQHDPADTKYPCGALVYSIQAIIATAIDTSQPCKSSHAAEAISIDAEELAPADFEIIDNDLD
ncbi:hypothetical protein B0H10DRAFT_1970494 [Mycena sp. CBHHK59/15]|nr:hypothetical protein B0H10DRAFT_1970494 [Mycena sp. CBHHK59/15]